MFQSADWEAFENALDRRTQKVGGAIGIKLNLPLALSFVWFQKGPTKISIDFVKELKGTGATFVRVEPTTLISTDVTKYKLELVSKKSLLCGQASPKATRVLDLSGSEEEILTQMKQKTRYNIRLSEKKGVKVTESDDVEVFYDLLLSTSGKKTGYYPHEKSYYLTLFKSLGGKGLVKIFVAQYQGVPLAAILVSFYGKTATYLHGGQGKTKMNLMAPYLCQWEAIKEAKKRGCSYYDFWGVSENDDPNDPWAGITRFKEGFGGRKVVFPGTYDIVLKPFWYNVLTIMAKLKHLLR